MIESFTKSGLSIPSIGLGTGNMYGSSCRRIVQEALELGYRHIEATKGAKGVCPCCGSELVAKCGKLLKKLDSNSDNETENLFR